MNKKLLQLKFKKAESLVEVIMAIFVVSVGASVATSLIVSALQSNEFSHDNLIASNLAIEGIEAVREIRDANWLKFGSDKPDCWNMMPGQDTCNSSNAIVASDSGTGYTVDLDLTSNKYAWTISKVSATLSLPGSGSDGYLLRYYPLVGTDLVIASKNSASGSFVATTSTPFYRIVQISYPAYDSTTNPNQPKNCTASGSPNCEIMDVTSTVQWVSHGVVHNVTLTSELTDYQKVKVAQ